MPRGSWSWRRGRRIWCALACGLMVAANSSWASAQTGCTMAVEEDWELVLSAPASIKNAPQVETVISPYGHINSFFGRITWNYREMPDYLAGGFQLQGWYGGNFLNHCSLENDACSTTGETIKWTQRLSTDGQQLRVTVFNGSSTTWGTFGGSNLIVNINAAVPYLCFYSTNTSVQNSSVTYGGNRVIVLKINEVRRYNAAGELLSTDDDEKVVYEQSEELDD